tara:strand:+ start:1066 stop:1269 length:204 start_codon:yes stop_codon:yes gene_type:complete
MVWRIRLNIKTSVSPAFRQIVKLSNIMPMTQERINEMESLSKDLIFYEEEDFRWIMEGVWLDFDEIK